MFKKISMVNKTLPFTSCKLQLNSICLLTKTSSILKYVVQKKTLFVQYS